MEKLWIYQSDRKFSTDEILRLQHALEAFLNQWNSHGVAISGKAEIAHHLFVLIWVDQSEAPSGCAIDSSVHFIKAVEKEFSVNMFERMNVAFRNQAGEVEVVSQKQFQTLLDQGIVNEDTIVFNNLIDKYSQ